jgi:hypothetical protein
MKHTIIALALLASFGVMAQETEATAQSQAQSSAGAAADSRAGAVGNAVYIDQSGPTSQTVNANSTATVNEHYTGRVENVQSGTTTNNTSVHYSGTQTVKNVPGIAMSGPASGPCTGVSGGLGLAGPGWGVGLNGAAVEPSCVVRENVRVIGMAMQSLDGAAFPQEKGELMILMMDAVRGLGAMNNQILNKEVKAK